MRIQSKQAGSSEATAMDRSVLAGDTNVSGKCPYLYGRNSAQKNPRQFPDEGFECLKNRRYLLSRFWHYHRLKVLNFCVRDGNRCDHFDMFTGRELTGLYALSILDCSTFWCDQVTANTIKLRHGPI